MSQTIGLMRPLEVAADRDLDHPSAERLSASSRQWAKHFQGPWEERARDERHKPYFRVMALAYGRHGANGHAAFERGQVGVILGTGGKPMHKSNVQRAIRAAIDLGLLAPESCSECLVVPGHAVQKDLGNPQKPCPVHGRKHRQRRARGGLVAA